MHHTDNDGREGITLQMDFDALTLEELKVMRSQIDGAIANYHGRRKRQAMDAVARVAREHGFTLSQLIGDKRPGKAVLDPAFVHPDDASLTWSGRGRRPAWVTQLLDAGRTLADLKA